MPNLSVLVITVPSQLNRRLSQTFLEDVRTQIGESRARVVLDCSGIEYLNRETIEVLMSVLEKTLQNNGDVRLAGLNRSLISALAASGARSLFEIFGTVDLAVASFRRGSSLAPLKALEKTRPGIQLVA